MILNRVNVVGFNNSKFDNIFFWKEIVSLFHGEKLSDELKFVGDGTKELKYIEFSNIRISDVRPLMGMSLGVWTENFFKNKAEYKKDKSFDIKQYTNYGLVRENWRLVLKYNM